MLSLQASSSPANARRRRAAKWPMTVSPAAFLLLRGASADSSNASLVRENIVIIESPNPSPTTDIATPTLLRATARAARSLSTPTVNTTQKQTRFVSNPPESPLGECEGDCDNDGECGEGLVCFQRDKNQAVPGCNGGENDNSYTDYCTYVGGNRGVPATASPTISESPTPLPSMSSAPTLSLVPSPSPTPRPTPMPNSASGRFKLRLYWHSSYYWQETRKQTYWCLKCRNGCTEGNIIEIDDCRYSGHYFQYYEGDQTYRPASDPSLCVTENGFERESSPLKLKKCDGGIKQQWLNKQDNNRGGFNFDKQRPWQINPAGKTNICVTQLHHPKAHENVFIRACWKPIKNDTYLWVTY